MSSKERIIKNLAHKAVTLFKGQKPMAQDIDTLEKSLQRLWPPEDNNLVTSVA